MEIIPYKNVLGERGLNEDLEKAQYYDYNEMDEFKLGELIAKISTN